MEYQLGVKDRLMLLNVLPPEGNLATIRIVTELRLALSFSEAEHADLQLVQMEGGGLKWNPNAPSREFEIGAKGQEIVRAALKKLDDDKKLTTDHIEICDIFEYTG